MPEIVNGRYAQFAQEYCVVLCKVGLEVVVELLLGPWQLIMPTLKQLGVAMLNRILTDVHVRSV